MEGIAAILSVPFSQETLERRSSAYASLLHLQQQHCDEADSNSAFFSECASLLSLILPDASVPDEEIAAQALKCLGFMVYHPSIVALISEEAMHTTLRLLANLVTTTEMKAVCNLSIWCVSVQQIDGLVMKPNLFSLLKAIIYAMNNPFDSLSITYEAVQAVVKLSSQLCDNMREMTHIWVPPIYRRLTSADKKEREMSIRCLLKLEQVIFPPLPPLSKEFSVDLEQNLLPMLSEMFQDGSQKIISIQAWKWYIRLLGEDALKMKHLVNKMLKILEKGFSEVSPCIQIASLVAWEALIEVLVPDKMHYTRIKRTEGSNASENSSKLSSDFLKEGVFRKIALLMKPILGIFKSKSPDSVHICSTRIWYYLLNRLHPSVNHPSVKAIVLYPVLELAFSKEYDRNIWLWDSILNLFDDCSLSEFCYMKNLKNWKINSCGIPGKFDANTLPIDSVRLSSISPFRFLPREYDDMAYFTKIILYFIRQAVMLEGMSKHRDFAFDVALKIFKSLLKGVRTEMKISDSNNCKQSYINMIMQLMKDLCQEVISAQMLFPEALLGVVRQFMEAIRDELETSIVVSPLNKVVLDVTYLKKRQLVDDEHLKIAGIKAFVYMDMVLPVVYMDLLYHHIIFHFIGSASDVDSILQFMHQLTSLFFSIDPLLHFHAVVSLMYAHWKELVPTRQCQLKLWMVISENLNLHIRREKDLTFFIGKDFPDQGYCLIQWFLSYPISVCFLSDKYFPQPGQGNSLKVLLEEELVFEPFFKVWKSLLRSLLCMSNSKGTVTVPFPEGLCKHLSEVLCENASWLRHIMDSELKLKLQGFFLVSVFGEISDCLLAASKCLQGSALTSERNKEISFENNNILMESFELISRFLWLSLNVFEATEEVTAVNVTRVFGDVAQIFSHLKARQSIKLLVEVISHPLTQWLSLLAVVNGKMVHANALGKFQLLWAQILECFQRSEPPFTFDSSLLRLLAPLLRATLGHPHQPIFEVTFAFWKDTFGKGSKLCYPDSLIPIIKRLERKGLISVPKVSTPTPKRAPWRTVDALRKGSLDKLVTIQRATTHCAVNEEEWDAFGHVSIEHQALGSKRFRWTGNPENSCSARHQEVGGQNSWWPREKKESVREVDSIMEMLRR